MSDYATRIFMIKILVLMKLINSPVNLIAFY